MVQVDLHLQQRCWVLQPLGRDSSACRADPRGVVPASQGRGPRLALSGGEQTVWWAASRRWRLFRRAARHAGSGLDAADSAATRHVADWRCIAGVALARRAEAAFGSQTLCRTPAPNPALPPFAIHPERSRWCASVFRFHPATEWLKNRREKSLLLACRWGDSCTMMFVCWGHEKQRFAVL